MKPTTLLLMSLSLITFVTPAFAAERGERAEKFVEGRIQKMIEKLELNDSQVQQIKAIREAKKPEMKAKRQAKRDAFKALTAVMQNDSASDAQIRDAYTKLRVAKTDVETARFETLLSIRKILTPEQRVKFREHMNSRKQGIRGKILERLQEHGVSEEM